MKKLITLAISALMIMSLSATVFAEDVESGDDVGKGTSSVPVKVQVSEEIVKVYQINISWDDLLFEYKYTDRWNTSNHNYDKSGEWVNGDTTGTITVSNHSNDAVQVAATVEHERDTGVNVSISPAKNDLDAYGGEKTSGTFTVNVEGQPDRNAGTITVAKVNLAIS